MNSESQNKPAIQQSNCTGCLYRTQFGSLSCLVTQPITDAVAKPNQVKVCKTCYEFTNLVCDCFCQTKPSWNLHEFDQSCYAVTIQLISGCYHTMLIVSNFEISWKLWNLVKMLKSSPPVQKHGMAEGPYTCWDKFCMFYWATWFVIELRISHHIFRVKIFHTKND